MDPEERRLRAAAPEGDHLLPQPRRLGRRPAARHRGAARVARVAAAWGRVLALPRPWRASGRQSGFAGRPAGEGRGARRASRCWRCRLLPALLRPPEPPPLAADVGLPRVEVEPEPARCRRCAPGAVPRAPIGGLRRIRPRRATPPRTARRAGSAAKPRRSPKQQRARSRRRPRSPPPVTAPPPAPEPPPPAPAPAAAPAPLPRPRRRPPPARRRLGGVRPALTDRALRDFRRYSPSPFWQHHANTSWS